MMKRSNKWISIALVGAMIALASCKKDDPAPAEEPAPGGGGGTNTASYVLVIDNGAQSMDRGQSIGYSAHLVSSAGAIVTPGSVSWSSSVGSITSGGAFSCQTDTTGWVTATVTHEGQTYTSSAPVNVTELATVRMFGIAPSAILWMANTGPVQLLPVYVGMKAATFSYLSENDAIASVSSSGNVVCKAAGITRIKVTGTIDGQTYVTYVPVMVIGAPAVTLPVVRITVTPGAEELFRGETRQLVAKAFNSNGDDVTSTVNFAYSVIPKKEDDNDNDPTPAVSVSSSGLVTANSIGSAIVKVVGNGVQAQAEFVVNPDTAIFVTPFNVSIGMANPSATLTAETYKVDRNLYRTNKAASFTKIANPSNLKWELPLTGVPEMDNFFKIVTIKSQNSNTAVIESSGGATAFGTTFVVAHSGPYGGVAAVTVGF